MANPKVLAKAVPAAMFGAASLTATLLTAPASANVDYFECTTDMVDSGVSEEAAIAACASARYPGDLGACVVDVNEFTGLTANSALLICQRSRRPDEVADCTINIHEAFLDSPSTKVLENCGRSLLPERYGTCVVDIVEATDISVDTGLTQCIQAGYRPWRIQPRLE
ncbi:MAG: hypothetical protein AAGJ95_15160 [Cyanobacteria bacterium J06554_11]